MTKFITMYNVNMAETSQKLDFAKYMPRIRSLTEKNVGNVA